MRILYIFPHPDDESFGPAAAIHGQLKKGDEVFLYTLTKGGATKQRHKLGLSIEEMGEVRYREMLEVEKNLGLTGMKVDDFTDSGLNQTDPRELETAISEHIQALRPNIVVTYAVHGISGFHDHIVTHAVVKRAFLELKKQNADYLKRLAFYTLPDNGNPVFLESGDFRVKHSDESEIDCVIPLSENDLAAMMASLDCYKTYQDTIKESGVREKVGDSLFFEFYGERFSPPLRSLTEEIALSFT